MPKVRLTEAQREQELFESVIKKYAGAVLMSTAEIAKRAGMPTRTLYKRLNQPRTFTLDELKRICNTLKIPEDERGKLI